MGLGGIGKGGALFGTDCVASFVDLKKEPGTTDQRDVLSFSSSVMSVLTLQVYVIYDMFLFLLFTW